MIRPAEGMAMKLIFEGPRRTFHIYFEEIIENLAEHRASSQRCNTLSEMKG